jgi:hypothetical protein
MTSCVKAMDNINLKAINNISLQLNPLLRQLSPRGTLTSPLNSDSIFFGMPDTPNSPTFTQAPNYQVEEGFLRKPGQVDAVSRKLISQREHWSTGSEARNKYMGNRDYYEDSHKHKAVEPTKEYKVENAYSTAWRSSRDILPRRKSLNSQTWTDAAPEYAYIAWSGTPPEYPTTPNFEKFLKDTTPAGRCYTKRTKNLGPEIYNSLRETVISSQRNTEHKIPERYKSLRCFLQQKMKQSVTRELFFFTMNFRYISQQKKYSGRERRRTASAFD